MKKLLTALLHSLSVFAAVISLSILVFATDGNSTLSILRQPDYLQSQHFATAVNEALNSIFDYVDLRNLFEKNGSLHLNQVIAQADENGTTVSYTLSNLINYARSMGYYLNAKNEIMDDGPATVSVASDERDHQIRVTFRAYMPEYTPASPADGMTTLGKLSQETLRYLAKYYEARSRFFDQDSNLKFRISFHSDDGKSSVYTNASSLSEEDIMGLGRYAAIDSDTLYLRSNFREAPGNLAPLLEARNPYLDGSYRFVLGVDTNFPYEDSFAIVAKRYNSQRSAALLSLMSFLLCFLLAGVSYGAMLLLTGRLPGQKQIQLYPIDRVPVECMVLFFLLWIQFIDHFMEVFLESLALVTGMMGEDRIWHILLGFLFKYVLFVPISLSIVRNYKADTLGKHSLSSRILGLVRYYMDAAEQTAPRVFSLLLFFLPNLAGLLLFALLCMRFVSYRSLLSLLTALALLCIMLAIDYYSFRITSGLNEAVSKQVKSERLKADLITNVSHDLKTPLTSIINYVDLLKREDIQNPRAQEYLSILEQKSARLKTLTEDLVEASKASSGNVSISFMDFNYSEILQQALGEFEDKLSAAKLTIVENIPAEPVMVRSDGRHLWRVIENLLNNCCKYALRGSRVYVDVTTEEDWAVCTIKNISEAPLNISPEELTERFVRGDVSRTTEGSGLGLSIAKSLTTLMQGELRIEIDGDLYKASIRLPLAKEEANNLVENS